MDKKETDNFEDDIKISDKIGREDLEIKEEETPKEGTKDSTKEEAPEETKDFTNKEAPEETKDSTKEEAPEETKGASKEEAPEETKDSSKKETSEEEQDSENKQEEDITDLNDKKEDKSDVSDGEDKKPSDNKEAEELNPVEQEVIIDNSLEKIKNKEKKSKSGIKKFFKTLGISLVGLIVLSYVVISVWFCFHYTRNTYIDDTNVSYKTVSSVKNNIQNKIDNFSMIIKLRNDATEEIKFSDLGIKVSVVCGAKEINNKQNGFLWPLYLKGNKKYTTKYKVTYDKAVIEEKLASFDCLKEENMIASENAYVEIDNGKAVVVPASEGTKINNDLFFKYIEEALDNFSDNLDLTESDCYENAAIDVDSPEIQEDIELAETYMDMVITFKIDQVDFELDSTTFGDWMYMKDDKWKFSKKYIDAYVEDMAAKYDTVGTTRTLKTQNGVVTKQLGKKYGWEIDKEETSALIMETLLAGKSVEITPLFLQKGYAYTATGDIGNNYVEVDLTNQHVYVISNGKLVVDCDCVTGNVAAGHSTPEGLYGVTYKTSPAVLRGDDYESKVSYWMPFNGGIGLHDATWRHGKFGGSIFQTAGSHGCVNLPLDSAAKIYKYVEKGMPVICYKVTE